MHNYCFSNPAATEYQAKPPQRATHSRYIKKSLKCSEVLLTYPGPQRIISPSRGNWPLKLTWPGRVLLLTIEML